MIKIKSGFVNLYRRRTERDAAFVITTSQLHLRPHTRKRRRRAYIMLMSSPVSSNQAPAGSVFPACIIQRGSRGARSRSPPLQSLCRSLPAASCAVARRADPPSRRSRMRHFFYFYTAGCPVRAADESPSGVLTVGVA